MLWMEWWARQMWRWRGPEGAVRWLWNSDEDQAIRAGGAREGDWLENGSAKCGRRGARISPKNRSTRLSSVTETDGAIPRCAAWQRRQFGSSWPLEWECGTTCSRKKTEIRASENAALAASRRFRRTSVNRVVRPVSKTTFPGTVALKRESARKSIVIYK